MFLGHVHGAGLLGPAGAIHRLSRLGDYLKVLWDQDNVDSKSRVRHLRDRARGGLQQQVAVFQVDFQGIASRHHHDGGEILPGVLAGFLDTVALGGVQFFL